MTPDDRISIVETVRDEYRQYLGRGIEFLYGATKSLSP
jgi:hypothetical protein